MLAKRVFSLTHAFIYATMGMQLKASYVELTSESNAHLRSAQSQKYPRQMI